jgi:hypothetical protein
VATGITKKAPNPKLQAPKKLQISSSKPTIERGSAKASPQANGDEHAERDAEHGDEWDPDQGKELQLGSD